MPVTMGGRDAFDARCKRIAKTEGQAQMYIGLDKTKKISSRKPVRGAGNNAALRWMILLAIAAMPVAAYAQGMVEVTPDQALNFANRLLEQGKDLFTSLIA